MIGLQKGDYERLSTVKRSLSQQRILSSVFDSILGTCEPKMGVITLGHVLAPTVKGPTLLTVTLQLGIWLSLDNMSCAIWQYTESNSKSYKN